jgi:hypothetical protein
MEQITLNQITTTVKSIKQVKKFNINSSLKFIQPFDIPHNEVNMESSSIVFNENFESSKPLIDYNENEIIEVPDFFSDFIDLNKYYIYGSKDLFETIEMIKNSEYMNQSVSSKKECLENLKNNMIDNLNTNYKEFNYKNTYISKTEIANLLNEKYPQMKILQYFCDFLNINCLYISVENKKFKLYKGYNQDNIKNNLVIIGYNKYMLPLINIKFDKFTYTDLSKIKEYFKEIRELNKIGSYTLPTLIEMANENNISLKDDETSKKKTKAVLYEELKKKYEI